MEQKRLYKYIEPTSRFAEGIRYYIETYGCQMNVRESQTIAGILESCGMTAAQDREAADFILFNTCCVRDHAEKRVSGNIGALKKRKDENANLMIGICGCMMQQEQVAIRFFKRFPYVNLLFGTHVIDQLPEFLEQVFAGNRVMVTDKDHIHITEDLPVIRDNQQSAFVNIMYGCNNYCTYCIVPYVRGPERSRHPDAICGEVEKLAAQGITEVTLLGQNVNSYGKDNAAIDFSQLLTRLQRIDGIQRIRFMTSHPKDLSDSLIEAIGSLPKVCHHVHLPMQSGSDRILKQMNRKYTRADYLLIVKKLRERTPDIELTTDMIVGFPGETEEDFQDTLSAVREIGFSSAFTFKYSPRQGTKAAAMQEQIEETVKKDRLLRLNQLQEEMTQLSNERYVGTSGEVLVEGYMEEAGTAYGKLSNLKMVYFPGDAAMIGKYLTVNITGYNKSSLIGKRNIYG